MDKTKGQDIKGISFQLLKLESTAFSDRFIIMVEGKEEENNLGKGLTKLYARQKYFQLFRLYEIWYSCSTLLYM